MEFSETELELLELQADILKMLANPKRLAIVHILRDQERTVGELIKITGYPAANISQHLSLLKSKGLVVTRRGGTHVIYALSSPKLDQACDIMREVLMEQLEHKKSLVTKVM
ncbi:MAG: metalloregulator ArsR/SmtB family transcription factor [Syntrophales bacterium]|nr:metalloregulator ArsR/SmtB family transcription factor [Syntrophales bacterium]